MKKKERKKQEGRGGKKERRKALAAYTNCRHYWRASVWKGLSKERVINPSKPPPRPILCRSYEREIERTSFSSDAWTSVEMVNACQTRVQAANLVFFYPTSATNNIYSSHAPLHKLSNIRIYISFSPPPPRFILVFAPIRANNRLSLSNVKEEREEGGGGKGETEHLNSSVMRFSLFFLRILAIFFDHFRFTRRCGFWGRNGDNKNLWNYALSFFFRMCTNV